MAFTNLIGEIGTELADPTVKFAIGAEHLEKHDQARRVVWVPLGGPTGPGVKGGANPRSRLTRNLSVDAYVFAEGVTEVDALLNALLAATHRKLHGSVIFGAERWLDANGQLLSKGRAVVIGLTFAVPVTDPALPTATVTAVAQTTSFDP